MSGPRENPPDPPDRPGWPVTLRSLRRWAADRQPFACLTCYDATTARWLERAGVPVLLVGDTAAEVILGHRRTIDMPLDVLIALTGAVKRGAPSTLVMGDMPFMSYQASDEDAIRNAGRFMVEGLADVVKVEAGEADSARIERLARSGIPVCGHVGSRPQHAGLHGGYGPAGRTARDADQVVRDARAMERAGCVLLLVEAVPDVVTARILEATSLPVIGIGAGTACHAQVLVLQDLLGITDAPPRFADPTAALGPAIQAGAEEWVRRVAARRIGGRGYTMAGEAEETAKPGEPVIEPRPRATTIKG